MTPGSLNPARVLRLAGVRHAGRRFLSFEGREYTFAEFDAAVERVAQGLVGLGVTPGDRVAIRSYNSDRMLMVMFAAARVGAVVVPLNTMLTDGDVAALVRRSGASVFCYGEGFGPVRSTMRAELPSVTAYLALESSDTDTDGDESGTGVRRHGASVDALLAGTSAHDFGIVDDAQPAIVIFTSGSSGTPKGVVKSFANVTWSAINRQLAEPRSSTTVELYTIPLTGVGFANFVVTAALVGAELVLTRRFEPTTVASLLVDHDVSHVFLAPTMIAAVLEHAGDIVFPSVAVVETAYEMSMGLRQAATVAFPRARFKYGYGMTEGAMSSSPAEYFLADPTVVGFGSGLDEFRVVRSDGSPADIDELGEIQIAGPTVMTGYLDDVGQALTDDGWLWSGDLGTLDAGGILHFRGRSKDMIKTGGHNVAAAEVEMAIIEDARVAAVAVVGLPHAYWGEAVVAFVVPAGERRDLGESLGESLRERLAGYMRPKQVVVVDALPLNPGGKVAKGKLRDEYAAMFEEPPA